MRRLKKLFRSFRPVYKVSTIIVDQQNNGEPFGENVWERILEGLRELGSYTAYKTYGGWEEEGRLIEEPGTLYFWIVQGEEKVQEVESFARELQEIQQQTSIYFEVQRIPRKSVRFLTKTKSYHLWDFED